MPTQLSTRVLTSTNSKGNYNPGRTKKKKELVKDYIFVTAEP